jgi:hypothetical protein
MLLELSFQSPTEYTQEAAPLVFYLYESAGEYLLPDVVLQSEPGVTHVELQEASVSSVLPGDGARGPLAERIASAWNIAARSARGAVAGSKELSRDVRLPVTLVDPAVREAGGRVAELEATWHYVFTDRSGTAAPNDVRVQLRFMATDVAPAPVQPGRFTDPYAVAHHLPAALRDRGEPQYKGFAAVDFGTSSCAVALADTRKVQQRSIDPGQATRLREELADLLRDSPSPSLAAQWTAQLGELLNDVHERYADCDATDVASLAAQLSGPAAAGRSSGLTDPLLDAVCVALEGRLDKSGLLADWLAPRLLECFDDSFSVPNLGELQMLEVVFNPELLQRDIPSSYRITKESPVQIELGAEGQDIERGLKSKLFENEERPGLFGRDGRVATTDNLIALVYLALATEAEEFARLDPEQPTERLTSIVATYPTTTAPSARQRLHELLKHCLGLDKVVVQFDEGVAAALFFLMRDFGTRRWELGAEALRARARQVSQNPPTWRQNMLLIDIGAGTTDIALLGLTLQDITPSPADPDMALVRGRHYVVRPEVLNSTGHTQLGGNYLTLRVFYWLKAAILEALLAGPGNDSARRDLNKRIPDSLRGEDGRAELALQVATCGIEEPAPPEVAQVLRATLPTHSDSEDPEAARHAFNVLWGLAENTKIAFGDLKDDEEEEEKKKKKKEEEQVIDYTQIREVLRAIDERQGIGVPSLTDLLPQKNLVLPWDQFEALARPVLEEAAKLAAWLVQTTFEGTPDDQLDRVALSGKTSKMPLVAKVVREILSAEGEAGGGLGWNTAALSVESERAKQAAALGACWAQSILERGTGGGETELNRGRTLLTIDVENLFHSLPCGFELLLQAGQTTPLLRPGAKMVETDEAGKLVARAPWKQLLPTFEVHRPRGRDKTIQWGVFRYYTYRSPDGFQLDPTIWGPTGGGTRDALIRAMLEIDQSLAPWLYLCYGEAHHFIDVPPEQEAVLRGALGDGCWDSGAQRLRELPAEVWVAATSPEDQPCRLFPAWVPADGQAADPYFDVFFHTSPDLESRPTPGKISESLPPPPADGDYAFFLRWPDGSQRELPPLRATGTRESTARYVATLDQTGTLRLHRGEPRFWAARSMRDVERTPGSVLKIRMEDGVPDIMPGWDPFNGKH